ncbi:hypothetical protein [Streptomyces sp. NEAU-W12]|uniref:hypothetical protein n=1 Tax=Streptomyces sp. NEAU-W12 TaxID=2994668 RepID=UPI00224A8B1F|nr:hypothetical protein [Streptomyces sp. NEAU-W12]MCX2925096.1 hypothetical protein [Streptomyces sp. NEAU-W12]
MKTPRLLVEGVGGFPDVLVGEEISLLKVSFQGRRPVPLQRLDLDGSTVTVLGTVTASEPEWTTHRGGAHGMMTPRQESARSTEGHGPQR